MTATRNGQTSTGDRIRDLIRKPSDPGDGTMWDAYPKDAPYDVLDVDETPPAPAPDVNADDSGRPARPVMLPVLPEWMRSAGGIRRNVRHAAPLLANRALVHGIRHGYAVRWVGWSFRGLYRLAGELWRFAIDAETLDLQRRAARAGDGRARAYERKERHKTRRARARWTAAALAGTALVVWLLGSPGTPAALRAVLAAGVLTVLVAHGWRPAGDPDRSGTSGPRPAMAEDPARSLVRSDRVVSVFAAAKVPGEVMTVGGVHRRDRDPEGWETIVDLPHAVTVAEVLKLHDRLCSAWRIPRERLHLVRGGHEGQVHMTVFDEDPMTSPPPRSRLAGLGSFSLWDPVMVGTTVFGDPYGLVLPGTSGMWICSAPGYGKTNLVLEVLGAGTLDQRAVSMVHDAKGEGGLSMYEDAARSSGGWFTEGSGDAGAKACLEMLDAVQDLREDRARKISALRREDPALMPQGAITPAVTGNAEFGLPLVLVVVDELNFVTAHPKHGATIKERVAGLSQVVRSGGILPVVAGQRFDEATLGPAQASLGIRVAFRTMSAAESNLVLGTGQAGEGFDTSRWPDHYQGVCVVRPAGFQVHKGTQMVRTCHLDLPGHIAVGKLAAELHRRADHRAVAAPAGHPGLVARDLVERVRDAMGADNVVPVDDLAARLGIDDVEAFVADLRAAGVPVEPSRQHGNRRAVRSRDLPSSGM